MGTEAILGTVLVVEACADTDALLGDPAVAGVHLSLERAANAEAAIARIEGGDAVDVVLLSPRLPDPVRIAQRLHSLDRQGAVLILTTAERREEVRHALQVAPFLEGDIVLTAAADGGALAGELAAAAARTRTRRQAHAERKKRRETPPPLSARYLGTLLDSAPIGIVTLDSSGAVIGWNKRAGEMLGMAEVEALGISFTELFDPAERGALGALIDSFETVGIGAHELEVTRDERTFDVSGARFAIRSGETGSLLILQDVTTRVRAERELELRNALLEAETESAESGIALTTMDGELLSVNGRWADIWGVDAKHLHEDLEGARRQMLDQVVDPVRFTAASEQLTASGGGSVRDEVQLKDGRTIERYATHARSGDGELIGRVWFHTDVTARKREERSLRFLADATNALSSSLDYETTLQLVADLAVPRMAAWCSIEIAEAGRHHAVAIAHDERLPGDEHHLQTVRQLDPRMVMTVPIEVRDTVFGAINFIRGPADPLYDDDDLRMAEELARRAAIAIDNSRVHAALRHTARTLQESLLPPHLPQVPGVELAARFRPAGAGMEVGGDFYDIFETGEGGWGIVVGDVCGKGAEAAALTALTRYTVRAAAMYEHGPAGILSVLNRALLRQRGDFRFTTVAYCELERSGAGLRLVASCGGHPQPLLLRADGNVSAVGGTGPLLGVVGDAEFREQAIDLLPGDAVVLYTDGLSDARAPGTILDENDLMTVLHGCTGLSAGETASRVEYAAIGAGDVMPRDDIALLVVKVAG